MAINASIKARYLHSASKAFIQHSLPGLLPLSSARAYRVTVEAVFLWSNSLNADLVSQTMDKLSQDSAGGWDPLVWLSFCFFNRGCSVLFTSSGLCSELWRGIFMAIRRIAHNSLHMETDSFFVSLFLYIITTSYDIHSNPFWGFF